MPFFITQSGNTLYITDGTGNSLRRIDTTNARVDTLVKSSIIGGHNNGAGEAAAVTLQARFNAPRGIAAADAGTLYVADSSNHRIRRVTIGAAAADTRVSDFAGSGDPGHGEGSGTAAQFNNPVGIAIGGTTLYVSETGNEQRIRTIDIASGAVRDLAGSTRGYAPGAGSAAQFDSPGGLAVSGNTLYIADINNHRIRAVDIPSGRVSDFAGNGTPEYADGVGAAARFSSPTGIAVNETGTTLYVTDSGNHRIREIDIATKRVRTIAGDGTPETKNGLGTDTRFRRPTGIVVSGSTLYVSTLDGRLIRKLEYREVGS